MFTMTKYAVFLTLIALGQSVYAVDNHHLIQDESVSLSFDIDAASLRGVQSDSSRTHPRSRELWAGGQWSFSNILFHVGVCKADPSCSEKSHPGPLHCGCPDCNKPHPPHFQNNYCENLSKSSLSSSSSSSSTSSAVSGGETVDEFSSDTSDIGNTQQGTRSFSPFMLLAGAAVAAMVGGAILMQKRKTEQMDEKAVPLDNESDARSFNGVSVAFAAALAKMGLIAGDKYGTDDSSDDESVASVKSAVSNRLSLMDRGIAVPPVYDVSQRTTSFMRMPAQQDIEPTTEGIEVESFRPSGVRYDAYSHPSTPYAV